MIRMANLFNDTKNLEKFLSDLHIMGLDLKSSHIPNHKYRGDIELQFSETDLSHRVYWSEISQRLTQQITSHFLESVYIELDELEYEIIDLNRYKQYSNDFYKSFAFELENSLCDKNVLLSSGLVGSIIQDYINFESYFKTPRMVGERVSKIGKVGVVDVLVDSHLSWLDNFMYTFSDFSYDFELIDTYVGMNGLISIKFTYDYIIDKPEKIYIFTSELNSNQDVLIRHNRKIKLKNILSDE